MCTTATEVGCQDQSGKGSQQARAERTTGQYRRMSAASNDVGGGGTRRGLYILGRDGGRRSLRASRMPRVDCRELEG